MTVLAGHDDLKDFVLKKQCQDHERIVAMNYDVQLEL